MTITINKPIFGENNVGIRASKVEEAIRNREPLIITVKGKGIGIHDPLKWKKTGKVFYKVFNFPDNPMKMISNYVKFEPTEEEKAKQVL